VAPHAQFPLGATLTLEELEGDPTAALARLRAAEPVSWLPALGGWLVTRHDLAAEVMRDDRRFTVDDPRFSTAQVIGPSMLSLDGVAHARHRAPFVPPFRPGAVRSRFEVAVEEQVAALIDALEPQRRAELRRSFAGPLAASIITRALGLEVSEVPSVLGWYDAIVESVTSITSGTGATAAGEEAFAALRIRLMSAIDTGELLHALSGDLTADEIVSNAAVLLFGGIETTEAMICNGVLLLLEHPEALTAVRRDPALLDAAIEESLRLEPAAAVIDRYATVDADLAGSQIGGGDLVRISLAAAGRDPKVFSNPDSFDLGRSNARRHLAFANGPHVCLGVHLARLETRAALAALLARLPDLHLDPDQPAEIRGLVFRKPPALHVLWG
jgi:cytochrome P450